MLTRLLLSGVLLAVLPLFVSAAERISVPRKNPGVAGNSGAPSVSGDGRFIAFESTARLTKDDTSARSDVYVYDRLNKTTRLVSDDRGGDQPVISANGRFVAYRSLDSGITRIRVRDLERGGVPLSASYPIDTSSYDRTAELAAISPDGRFVAFVFRRAPNVDSQYPFSLGNQIVIADIVARTAERVKFRPPVQGDNGESINQLGRVALSADASFVVLDSTDPLVGNDLNAGSDVYRASVSTLGLKRLSTAVGVPDLGGATQPVFALDGNTAFYLCDNPLVAADTDGAASIYSNSIADNFVAPTYVPSENQPVSLATQATISGTLLAFINNRGRAFLRNLAQGSDVPLTRKANAAILGATLSGDDRLAAFFTRSSNLSPGDAQSTFDVFAARVPGDATERPAPTASVALSNGTGLVPENTTITIGASAVHATGSHKLLTVEVNGRQEFRSTSATLPPQNFLALRGVYDVRARAFNDAWIEGKSESTPLIVVPAPGKLGITGTSSLERTDAADGSATFSATMRIDNRKASASPPLQVVVTITSQPQKMAELQGDLEIVPNRGETILTVIDVPAIPAMAMATISFAGTTPATEVIGNGYQGNGWTVLAQLREQNGANFVNVEAPVSVLTTYARLNENTDLPNTGIPVTGPPNGGGFNSGLLQSITINGPANVVEGASTTFRALAVFSNGSQACTPEWSVTGANASISPSGRFAAGSVDVPTKVTVRANFSGKSASTSVTIKPTSPVVTIAASDPLAAESGDTGQLRILRTGRNKGELAVGYSITGKATNGSDYTQLNGTATIPAGASSVVLDVLPQQDNTFEGAEDVVVTLEPDSGYRLKKNKRSASVEIADDEVFPADQPDLTIRTGDGPTIGSLAVDTDPEEIGQLLRVSGKRDKPIEFAITLINRGDAPRYYSLRGGAATTGFTVQYLDGTNDITDQMISGYYVVPQLAPNAAHEITLVVTPTSATPIGGSLETIVVATADTLVDAVESIVERVK